MNQLRVFAAVAAEGTITRAAKALGVSQPAVSKQLGELEGTLGVALFDRLPRGVRPTEAGRLLQQHADRIFATESQAEADLAALADVTRGRLRVGASTTIGSYLVPALFGRFQREHPSVRLELEIANTQAIQRELIGGDLDLALTEGFVRSEALEVEVVTEDEIVTIVAPGHPWASHRSIGLQALTKAPILLRERGSGTRDVIEAALAEHGVRIDPVMSLGSTEAVKNAVAAGLGASMVSRLTVELELDAGRLVEVTVTGLRMRRALHLLTRRGHQPSAAAEAFLKLVH